MRSILQGLLLGLIMVLPGMSGGTAFLIMGIYEQLILDLGRLRIKPYIPLLIGIIAGLFAGGTIFALVFEAYRDITAALLLGCILASIRAVVSTAPKINGTYAAFLLGGLILGLVMAGEPLAVVSDGTLTPPLLLLIGGAFSTAAMVIPGVPGSSVLIVLGIYDSLLLYIKELALIQLMYFGIGAVLGLFLLVKLLENLYTNYRPVLSYFFAGLIVGAARAVIPHTVSPGIVLAFAVGFVAVWMWSGHRTAEVT